MISLPIRSAFPIALPPNLDSVVKELLDKGWGFYVLSVNRGYCNPSTRKIVIPTWAFRDKKEPDYPIYYIAHEVAHALAKGDGHGKKWAKTFLRLCPSYLHYLEFTYKPSVIAYGACPPADF